MATGNPKTKWKRTSILRQDRGTPDLDVTLSYERKTPEQDILLTNRAQTSLLWSRNGTGTKSRLYFGDNLSLLALLLDDPEICGRVKLIYIDPPFATNSIFQSRSQTDAYHDILTGANYIEFLRQRLILLRELMADDGSIYVHLDENMAFYIKIVLDEVFGKRNFRNWITRRKCSHKNFTKKTYGNISDYIMFYSKSDAYIWNRPHEEWTLNRAQKEYTCIEESTGRRYKKVPIHAPGVRNGDTGKPWRGMSPPPGKHWQYAPATLDEMDARGEIYWSPTGNPRRKIYLDNSDGVAVQDIWYDFRDDRNQNVLITGYPTEKNPAVIERIIKASSNPGDLVLDCFCGSGTTLAVAEQLGRTWIGMDNSPEAVSATLGRFAGDVERMGDYVRREREIGQDAPAQTTMLDLLHGSEIDIERGTPVQAAHITNFSLFTDVHETAEIGHIVAWWDQLQQK